MATTERITTIETHRRIETPQTRRKFFRLQFSYINRDATMRSMESIAADYSMVGPRIWTRFSGKLISMVNFNLSR